MSVAIVLAGGAGRRLTTPTPKAFVSLAGKPIVQYSLEAIAACAHVDAAVVVVPRRMHRETEHLLMNLSGALVVRAVVTGGPSRQESVRMGLEAIGKDADLVICHDAARPFAPPELFSRVLEAVVTEGEAHGAVPLVRTSDTVKRIDGDWVVETIPRDEVGFAQTPQAFKADALRRAHDVATASGRTATDDAMLVEEAGMRVIAIGGDPRNFKITTADDLARAEEILSRASRGSSDHRG